MLSYTRQSNGVFVIKNINYILKETIVYMVYIIEIPIIIKYLPRVFKVLGVIISLHRTSLLTFE